MNIIGVNLNKSRILPTVSSYFCLLLIPLIAGCSLSQPIYPTSTSTRTSTPQQQSGASFDCQASVSPWDISWLPSDQDVVSERIDSIISGTGLSGFSKTILQDALDYQVNPAYALATFRKEDSLADPTTRAYKNNNPGNIIATGGCSGKPAGTTCSGIYGETSTDGRFGIYPDMGAGIKAYFMLLHQEYAPGTTRNCSDISCIVQAYCPPSDCDTQNYIDQVLAWTKDYQCQLVNENIASTSSPTQTPTLSPIVTQYIVPTPTQLPIGRVSKIAFISDRDGNYEIYIMNADGSDQTRLTFTPDVDEEELAVSPDGNKIAYTGGQGNASAIFVMNVDGSNQTRLTNIRNPQSPEWSPNGEMITYIGFQDSSWGVYVMNSDGSNQTLLASLGNMTIPIWSPDSRKIIYSEGHDYEAWNFTVVNVDGSGSIQITVPPFSGNAAWSPDGNKIIYLGFQNGYPIIYMMNPDGSNQIILSNSMRVQFPFWSPDGSKIAMWSVPPDYIRSDIYVMNADGSDQICLTNSGGNYVPKWSPDGKKIAFTSDRDGSLQIYVMNADGSDQKRLTISGINISPAWIYYQAIK